MATAVKKPAAKKPVAKKTPAPKKETAPKAAAANEAATETKAPAENNTKFVIRDDVPYPARTRTGGGVSVYPLAQLVTVGQSFEVKADVDKDLYTNDTEYQNALKEEKRAIQNRLSGAARRFMKSNPDVKLAVRVLKDGSVGVWRVDAE